MSLKTTPCHSCVAAFKLALFLFPLVILIGTAARWHVGAWMAALGMTALVNLGLFVWATGPRLPVLGDREVG